MSILDDLKATTPEPQPEPQQEPDPQPDPDAPSQQDWTSIRHSLYGLSVQVADLTTAVNAQSSLLQGLTSQPPGAPQSSTTQDEKQLDEIAKTLTEFASLLDGETVREASKTLSDVSASVTKATAANSKAQAAAAKDLDAAVEEVKEAASALGRAGTKAVHRAATDATKAATAAVDARDKAAEERAARIISTVERFDENRVWVSLASAALVLVPFVLTALLVVVGAWAMGSGLDSFVNPDAGKWTKGFQVVAWTAVVVLSVGGLFVGGVWISNLLDDAREEWRRRGERKAAKKK